MAYEDAGYIANRNCPCLRCKVKGLMGAAVLVTVGVISLLHNFTGEYGWHNYWSLLLIVIGLMLFGQRSASIAGHIQPNGYPPLPGTMPSPAATAGGTNNSTPGSGDQNV